MASSAFRYHLGNPNRLRPGIQSSFSPPFAFDNLNARTDGGQQLPEDNRIYMQPDPIHPVLEVALHFLN
jgi:hypothetical protein